MVKESKGIGRTSIRRLARRGGVKRISGNSAIIRDCDKKKYFRRGI